MKIIFMGTPPFALSTLDALIAAGHEIAAVYTRAPQPAGRGKALAQSAVHRRAAALGIPVQTPQTLRDTGEQARFASFGADIAVVAAYGLLLPQAVLETPARGCLNVHASLLPRWRGAAPIQRAILAGDATTGVTIMAMAAGLDTGPMIERGETAVAAKTAGELTDELAAMGAALMVAALAGDMKSTPQPETGATLAPKISKVESRLDFARPALLLERAVRAFNPAPGAWCEIAGERIKILSAAVVASDLPPGHIGDALVIGTADGGLAPLVVQRAGKPAMPVDALLNGWSIPAGTVAG